MKGLNDSSSQIASELERMAILLNKFNLCSDTKPLYDAAGRCRTNNSSETWGYSFDSLKLPIDIMSHTKPFGAYPFDVAFSVDITGVYSKPDVLRNPIIDIKRFDIEIFGLSEMSCDVYAAWHLDKDAAGEQKFIHPEYHITFGGHRMWDNVSDYGGVLILPSPRIAHPPMDAILGIDFIIRNFTEKEHHSDLINETEYKGILQNSIYRLWRPYFSFIGNFWETTGLSYSDFSMSSIMPALPINI